MCIHCIQVQASTIFSVYTYTTCRDLQINEFWLHIQVALVSITVAISASLPYSGSILLAYKLVTSKQLKLKMKINFSFSDMMLT